MRLKILQKALHRHFFPVTVTSQQGKYEIANRIMYYNGVIGHYYFRISSHKRKLNNSSAVIAKG